MISEKNKDQKGSQNNENKNNQNSQKNDKNTKQGKEGAVALFYIICLILRYIQVNLSSNCKSKCQ